MRRVLRGRPGPRRVTDAGATGGSSRMEAVGAPLAGASFAEVVNASTTSRCGAFRSVLRSMGITFLR